MAIDIVVDEAGIFEHVASIIENRKSRAAAYANREVTLMYWEVGRYIGSVILDGGRGKYGKQLLRRCRNNCSQNLEIALNTQRSRA